MNETTEEVVFKQEGKNLYGWLNKCSMELSQYDDGRWYVGIKSGYETDQTNPSRCVSVYFSDIVATQEEAEARAVEIARLGHDGIKAMRVAEIERQIAWYENQIAHELSELAALDIQRAMTSKPCFAEGFRAGQKVLQHVVWSAIGSPLD